MRTLPEALKIILLSMAATTIYGVLHDQVTAHLCVEYFTVAHPMIIPTRSPFLLAIFWGVLATWWVGFFLGAALAVAAQVGPAPKLRAADLTLPILAVMILSGVAALLAGAVGATLMAHGLVSLDGWLAEAIPADRHAVFFADASAHMTSYAAGGLGGLAVIALTIRRRVRAPVQAGREAAAQDSRPG